MSPAYEGMTEEWLRFSALTTATHELQECSPR